MPHVPGLSAPQVVGLMGVAGSGKTALGRRLAEDLGWDFIDADDFHSPANVAKMAAGQPLDDADRAPWLAALRARLVEAQAQGRNTVLACSALKERYRAALAASPVKLRWAHLRGDFESIAARLRTRPGHFFKAELLRSQYEALEPPADALELDARAPLRALVTAIRTGLAL